jgi:hypothetical protein
MKRLSMLMAMALGACATVPADAGPSAGLGQAATVGGATIRPIQVIEDSRCPVDAVCVWAGRLILLAEVDYRGGSETFRGNLTLGEPLRVGLEAVTLVAAEPAPLAGKPIDPRAYRFTFAYSRTDQAVDAS